jgi:hypothetical protein
MRQRIQIVIFTRTAMKEPEISEVIGIPLSVLNRAHMAYDMTKGGLKPLKPKRSGGRIN